jgi:hypothetical protein
VVNAIIKAAETCDAEAINDFFNLALDSGSAHIDLIEPTLSSQEFVRRQRAISQGAILLGLFNHFALHKRFGEIDIIDA